VNGDEKRRRELAWAHRDDIIPGSERAIQPKELGQIVSVRLTTAEVSALRDYADKLGWTMSEVIRHATRAMVGRPIGWQCEHMNMTSLPGILSSPHGYCGCEMRPVYDVSELRKAPA